MVQGREYIDVKERNARKVRGEAAANRAEHLNPRTSHTNKQNKK